MPRQVARFAFIVLFLIALSPSFAQTTTIEPALLLSANTGDAAAQIRLGEFYAAGKTVGRDLNQAAEWYRKAAEKGDLTGQLHLAALYRDGGKGFPRDMQQAAAWYRKAAEQGDTGAEGILGVLYSYGQGVPRSDVEAYYWFDMAAAAKGPNQAQYAANRQMVGTRITAEELEDVQDRVAKWFAAHPRPGTAE